MQFRWTLTAGYFFKQRRMVMFCKNCGKELSENALFCPTCGTAVNKPASDEALAENIVNASDQAPTQAPVEAPAQAPAEESSQATAQATVEAPAETVAQAPVEEPFQSSAQAPVEVVVEKKKKKGLKIIASVIAVILIFAIGFFAFAGPYAMNMANKLLRSPEGYLAYVVGNNIEDFSEDFSQIIDIIDSSAYVPENISASIEVEAGDGLKNIISQEAGESASLINWIDKLGIDAEVFLNEEAVGVDADLYVNDEAVLNVGEYMDVSEEEIYVWSNDLLPAALKLSSYEADIDFSDYVYSYSMMKESMESISKILPDSADVEDIINRYVLAAVGSIKKVKEESSVLKVGEKSEKCTLITATIDAETILPIIEAVLKEAENDKTIKNIIKNVCDAYGQDSKETLSSYNEFIQEGLAFVDETDPSGMGEFSFDLLFNVDNKGNIMGIGFEFEGISLSYASINDGDKTAEEIKLEASGVSVSIAGECTEKGDVINGEYNVIVNDFEVLCLTVEDFDMEKYGEGMFVGKATLSLTDDINEMISFFDADSIGIDDISTIKLVMIGDAKSKNESFTRIEAEYQGELFAAINIEAKVGESGDFEKPDDYVGLEESQELFSALDPAVIIGKLENAGAPQEFLEYLQNMMAPVEEEASEPGEEYDLDLEYDEDFEFDFEYDEDYGLDFDYKDFE